MQTLNDKWLAEDAEYARLSAEEALVLDVSEELLEWMERKGVTRAELAKRLGTSRARVSQLFGGTKNLTLRTLARLCHELGLEVRLELRDTREAPAMKTKTAVHRERGPRQPVQAKSEPSETVR